MLPDENAPTDFEFRMGEFGSDAAVAAGGSADALGAAALQGGVSADAWEQKNGKIGVFGILQGNWGQPGTESTAGKDKYMREDIKSGPAMFVCLQECVLSVYTHLLSPGTEGIKKDNFLFRRRWGRLGMGKKAVLRVHGISRPRVRK